MTSTRFEDRLLAELRLIVATRTAPDLVVAPRQRRKPRLLLAGAATAAAAGTAFLLVASSGKVTPAFAVERQADGNVTVTINRLSDAPGLERQLRAAGIPAVVNYTPAGKACQQPRGRRAAPPGKPAGGSVSGTSIGGRSTTFTVSRNIVGAGDTLVIMTSGGNGPTTVGMEVITGPVSPCKLVDAPLPPKAPASGFSTSGAAGN